MVAAAIRSSVEKGEHFGQSATCASFHSTALDTPVLPGSWSASTPARARARCRTWQHPAPSCASIALPCELAAPAECWLA
jgi:hypothetical protein